VRKKGQEPRKEGSGGTQAVKAGKSKRRSKSQNGFEKINKSTNGPGQRWSRTITLISTIVYNSNNMI